MSGNQWSVFSFDRICDCCLASGLAKSDKRLHYKNFTSSAAWPLTRINHQMYLQMPGRISVWNTIPGWTLESATFDWMHNLFLGSGRDLIGSTFKTLIRRGAYSHLPVQDMDTVLAILQEEMIHDCR